MPQTLHYLNEKDLIYSKLFLILVKEQVEDFYKYSHMMTWDEIKNFFDYLPADFIETCRLNTINIGELAEFYDLKTNLVSSHPVSLMYLITKFDMSKYEHIQQFANSPHKQDRQYQTNI